MSIATRIARSFAIVLGLSGLWWLSGTWRISRGFAQLIFPNYVVLFSTLLVAAVALRTPRGAVLREAAIGAAIGHLLGVLSVIAATLLAPYGLERIFNGLRLEGVLGSLLFELVYPAVLGGWLFGAAAFALSSYTNSSVSRSTSFR